ncbi:hypothetical protein E2C01_084019 [Portunus trituberculatus]|uniref:Uncharacterized protein n=1 Tax=Portunus trituberculatus TaxID=210409 RepID=A0A5B7J354_PORTR|nr:hypothetical protein [Portunus trituberculatus]
MGDVKHWKQLGGQMQAEGRQNATRGSEVAGGGKGGLAQPRQRGKEWIEIVLREGLLEDKANEFLVTGFCPVSLRSVCDASLKENAHALT